MIPRQRIALDLLRFLVKNPKWLIMALLLGGLSYSYEFFYARDTMSFMGIPRALDDQKEHYTRIFRNEAYMVGYSDIRGNPLWVVYKLLPHSSDTKMLKRPERFERDWRNLWMVGEEDYTRSGYDRGHMAPNYALAQLYGQKAQHETFLITNITPQKPSLNQKIWQRLESLEYNVFAPRFKALWVYTGPLFEAKARRLKSSPKIDVPHAFYKIYIGLDANGSLHALSFIIPQTAKADDALEKYVVSIDEIERKSGFDFFHRLSDATETSLEDEILKEKWF